MKGQADEAKKEDKDTPSTLQTVGDNSAGMVIWQFVILLNPEVFWLHG